VSLWLCVDTGIARRSSRSSRIQLNQRIEELLALRDELCSLVADWDERLAATPQGARAHLLETLGDRAVIERTRHTRRDR
jgi:hypothetical protein